MKSNERFAALAARQGVPGLEGVKALSIRAPWGWLVGKGLKPVENREWDYNPIIKSPQVCETIKAVVLNGGVSIIPPPPKIAGLN